MSPRQIGRAAGVCIVVSIRSNKQTAPILLLYIYRATTSTEPVAFIIIVVVVFAIAITVVVISTVLVSFACGCRGYRHELKYI